METLCPVVLITEVTRGAGYEISKLFARAKFRMVIVSKECATLHNVSEILKTLGAPSVSTICIDLSNESAAEEIMAKVTAKEGSVSILINCIGGHHSQVFAENHIRRQSRIIHQDVLSVVKLTSLVLDQMRIQGKGTILQVLSTDSDHLPEPAEEAAQSFVMSYMQAVSREPRNAGIKMVAHSLAQPKIAENADYARLAKEFYDMYFEGFGPKPRARKKATVS